MSKRFLLGWALIASLAGGVACDDQPAGDTMALGGHWFGEAAAMFAPWGISVTVSTDAGELRIINYYGDEADTMGDGPIIPESTWQVVANVSADGAPSDELIAFFDGEGPSGYEDLAAALDTGLSGSMKVYFPLEMSDTASPAGEPPAGGPPVFPTAAIYCSSAGAGEGECNYDGGIAVGQATASTVYIDLSEPADAPAAAAPSGEIVAFSVGEYQGESYEQPSSLADLVGGWGSLTGPAGMDIDSSGNIDGGDIATCVYGGTFAIIDSTKNVYRMNLDVSNCGEFDGAYTGLAAVLDAATFDGAPGEAPVAEEGDVMLFQVDNGEFLLTDALMYYGVEP